MAINEDIEVADGKLLINGDEFDMKQFISRYPDADEAYRDLSIHTGLSKGEICRILMRGETKPEAFPCCIQPR